MLFYIHYMLMTSGLSGTSVLLAVFFKTYSDASQGEIGVLLMTFPFVCLVIKPLFCSIADRKQAHKRYLIIALLVELLGYAPFAIIPFFPQLYEQHPRVSWYLLVIACHVGNGGLGVAWSLGDCLAVNMSQKNGTPFGRMRLMGTISWGVYGFIIGQINEVYFLPKYVPAFLILIVSLIAELALIICWKNEDFEMVDPLGQLAVEAVPSEQQAETKVAQLKQNAIDHFVDSAPSSLCGTLRLNAQTANIFKAEDLERRLNVSEFEKTQVAKPNYDKLRVIIEQDKVTPTGKQQVKGDVESNLISERKNPQIILLKMIFQADGRVLKYLVLFTVFGYIMAPMNFVFLSMESVCKEKGYNFSQLAGAVLISQATIETIAFLIVPFILRYITRSLFLTFGFLLMAIRFFFYAGWYYTADISPYWAVIGEWAHGFSYGIFCIIQADVALMFASQSRLFIPELRKLGFLSDEKSSTKEQIEAEERSIKMALRATIQALFGGFMDGLGQGAGALICGIFVEVYSYISLWSMYWMVAISAVCIHQLVEFTRSRWSDTYQPAKGTKAYEIMQLASTFDESGKKISDKAHNLAPKLSIVIENQHDKTMECEKEQAPAECC